MQPSRFVILTGHLNDYPLSDLVGILRHQRKTGRLLIEYPKGPASFFFRDGELVDAQLDNLSGLQAVCVAVAQPASSFNFNPLIQPPKRSIENSMQRVVSELLGCWDENGLEIDALSSSRSATQPAFTPQAAPQPALLAAAPSFNISQMTQTEQALVFSSVALEMPKSNYSRPLFAMAAAGLMMLGLSTVIALTGGFGRRGGSSGSPTPTVGEITAAPVTNASTSQSDNVANEEPKPFSETSRKKVGVLAPELNRKAAAFPPMPEAVSSTKSREVTRSDKPAEKNQQKPNDVTQKAQSVRVVLRIENGRVAQASIANPQPGMNVYEALALRIARQRRYPAKSTGPETVVIKVTPSN
jgi:hypothetical protein